MVETIEINLLTQIKVPTVPNFLKVIGGSGPEETANISITECSEDELREIGEAWTEKLLESARQKRLLNIKEKDNARRE